MTLIANVFPNLRTVNNVVRKMSKKRRLRTPFNSQHVKESQTVVHDSTLMIFFHHSGKN